MPGEFNSRMSPSQGENMYEVYLFPTNELLLVASTKAELDEFFNTTTIDKDDTYILAHVGNAIRIYQWNSYHD